MKPQVAEWVRKAEDDFATLSREARVRKRPNYDGLCFHAQQCAEKYLKACLQEARRPFPRTHDLVALLELLRAVGPTWEEWRPELNALTRSAVEVRYPGFSATREDAREACAIARSLRAACRRHLGLDEPGRPRRRRSERSPR